MPELIIQAATKKPKPIIGVHERSTIGAMTAVMALTAKAHFNFRTSSMGGDWRHRAIGPTPIKNNAGVMSGTNTASK